VKTVETTAASTVQRSPGQLADELAEATHELKAPIAIAIALCANAEAADAEALRADLRRIEAQLRSLRDQLEAVLELPREHAARSATVRAADVASIVQDASEGLGVVAEQKDVELTIDADAGMRADVDPERVSIAVRNLVVNAVRHAPEGGRVRCSLMRDGAWARIEVADDGPGVPVEDRATIFERFRRLERDAGVHPGSGLGLAIVRDVATEHGGRVEVGDAAEGGALFALELPLRPAGEPFGRHLRAVARGAA